MSSGGKNPSQNPTRFHWKEKGPGLSSPQLPETKITHWCGAAHGLCTKPNLEADEGSAGLKNVLVKKNFPLVLEQSKGAGESRRGSHSNPSKSWRSCNRWGLGALRPLTTLRAQNC